jgi:hypothetical protein
MIVEEEVVMSRVIKEQRCLTVKREVKCVVVSWRAVDVQSQDGRSVDSVRGRQPSVVWEANSS